MSINVYWTCIEKEWLRASPPIPILNRNLQLKYPETGIQRCPAFNSSLKNMFGLESCYSYEFYIKDNQVCSDYYDQEFFNDHVLIRSLTEKTFSFQQYYSFFTDEPSLKITANLSPFLEDNNITKNCIPFPGEFDIGKWFRNLEFAFSLKKDSNLFKITEGEIYSYIKFHTDKKINFIQYRHSPQLVELLSDVTNSKFYSDKIRKLSNFYYMMRTKKLILKEIKKNVL